jgi:hypothetical protein
MDDDDHLIEQKEKKQKLRANVKSKLKATFSREEEEKKKRRDSKVICEDDVRVHRAPEVARGGLLGVDSRGT